MIPSIREAYCFNCKICEQRNLVFGISFAVSLILMTGSVLAILSMNGYTLGYFNTAAPKWLATSIYVICALNALFFICNLAYYLCTPNKPAQRPLFQEKELKSLGQNEEVERAIRQAYTPMEPNAYAVDSFRLNGKNSFYFVSKGGQKNLEITSDNSKSLLQNININPERVCLSHLWLNENVENFQDLIDHIHLKPLSFMALEKQTKSDLVPTIYGLAYHENGKTKIRFYHTKEYRNRFFDSCVKSQVTSRYSLEKVLKSEKSCWIEPIELVGKKIIYARFSQDRSGVIEMTYVESDQDPYNIAVKIKDQAIAKP